MIKITHKQYEDDIIKLIQQVKHLPCLSVYGIPRGGHYPAAVIAKHMNLKLVLDPEKIDEWTLIVDDLIDSGATYSEYREKYPTNRFAFVYCKKPLSAEDNFYCAVQAPKDEWLVFPDESGDGIEENLRRTLEYIGEDTTREGLLETPSRMRKAYDEIFAGYKINPKDLVKTFVQGTCKEMVILKNAEFYSTCEHHFFPFFGHCSIGYIPKDKVIGVSKLARLLDCYSKRMQIQERMTTQIADFLEQELEAEGVYVVCEGVHFCMTSRGIKKQDASMITSAIRGRFHNDSALRAEFLSLIK